MSTPALETERVFAEAEKFLGYIVDAADELGVELPEKHVVTSGEAVHDCNQVVVTVTGIATGPPGAETFVLDNCPPMWTMSIDVDIVRCGLEPNNKGQVSVHKLTLAAEQSSADTAVLMNATNRKLNERFGGLIASIVYLPPSGGTYVTRLQLQLSVN